MAQGTSGAFSLFGAWWKRGERWLYPYRPRFRDWRFWTVQGLALLIAGLHTTAELLKVLGHPVFVGEEPRVAFASFVSVSLLYVPVVYAALNFGLRGAVATAVWCTLLTIPNIVVFHQGAEKIREAIQMGVVDAIAVFVGQRVEREMSARQRAEAAGTALAVSESKYRGLFESSPVAILVTDDAGQVLEANPAAAVLFGRSAEGLTGARVADLLGVHAAEKLTDTHNGQWTGGHLDLSVSSRSKVYLEPRLTRTTDQQGKSVVQVVLRDVTEQVERQAGLKAYAAYILRAQEEERKRMAQDLHDDSVQRLVLLCRHLDALEIAKPPLPDTLKEIVRDARKSAEESVQNLRDFARALRPPTLEDLGLITSIRRLLVDVAEHTGAEGHLRVVGNERRLPLDVELGLFRIAQESLRNIERHAGATRVAITIFFGAREVRLEVSDNGAGFKPPSNLDAFGTTGHLGLLGMQERTELLGGKFEVLSSPGQGTKITTSVPA